MITYTNTIPILAYVVCHLTTRNARPCEFLGSALVKHPLLRPVPMYWVNNALSVVSSQKDIGVTVNNILIWSLHVSHVVAKANRMLGFLRWHCLFIGPDRKKLLYLTFVRSYMGFASEIWAAQSSISNLRLLDGVQRRATRYILSCH